MEVILELFENIDNCLIVSRVGGSFVDYISTSVDIYQRLMT